MSDKNRKDGEFSLPDMREMFEHYTSVEDDEPAVQRSEWKISRADILTAATMKPGWSHGREAAP